MFESGTCDRIMEYIKIATGVTVQYSNRPYYELQWLFKKGEMRDVLDAITEIPKALATFGYKGRVAAEEWFKFVEIVFQEESMGYRLDENGVVHYYVDEEFNRNRYSTLSLLDDEKYVTVKAEYEKAFSYLDRVPPDTKAAVRSMFEALEILFKQITGKERLNRYFVKNDLKELCLRVYEGDDVARRVGEGFFDGFGEWVNALHNYRHGQDTLAPPPEDLTVYILSSGSAYLRWLIGAKAILEGI